MENNLQQGKKSNVLRLHPAAGGAHATAPIQPDNDCMIRLQQVLRITGVGRSTWYKLVKKGEAPAGKLVSAGIRAWSEVECRAWVASRPSAAPGATEES